MGQSWAPPSHTPLCSSNRKGNLRVILDSSRQLSLEGLNSSSDFQFPDYLFQIFEYRPKGSNNNYYYYFTYLGDFHTSVSRWFSTGVWVTTSLLKSPGLFSVFWPISSSSLSSCRASSTHIPDPLSLLLPIVHRLWLVLWATSLILIELLYVSLLLLGHVRGSIGEHQLWARPRFSRSVLHDWFV